MFLVTSTYRGTPEAIAAALPAHREWVGTQYDRGVFILSGRLVPPTGGFMVAIGIARAALDALLATDPFRQASLLDHTVLELAPTRWAACFEPIKELL